MDVRNRFLSVLNKSQVALSDFYYSHKLLIKWLCLPTAIVIIFCSMSFFASGGIGMPMQPIMEFNMSNLQEHMTDLELRGEILFSLSGQGIVNIPIENAPFERFSYITIFMARQSDVGFHGTRIRPREIHEEYFTRIRWPELHNGKNTIYIGDGAW